MTTVIMIKPVAPNDAINDAKEPPLGKRLLWMGALMLGGLVVVAASAYILRALLLL